MCEAVGRTVPAGHSPTSCGSPLPMLFLSLFVSVEVPPSALKVRVSALLVDLILIVLSAAVH